MIDCKRCLAWQAFWREPRRACQLEPRTRCTALCIALNACFTSAQSWPSIVSTGRKGLRAFHARAGGCLGSRGRLGVCADRCRPQELALAGRCRLPSVPASPAGLSPDCRTKRIAGDRYRRPLRALSRAVRAKRARQGARHRLLVDGRASAPPRRRPPISPGSRPRSRARSRAWTSMWWAAACRARWRRAPPTA